LAKKAIILHDEPAGQQEVLLSYILDFFAVPWEFVEVRQMASRVSSITDTVAFGSARVVAALLREGRECAAPAAFYVYANNEDCAGAVQFLIGDTQVSLKRATEGKTSLSVSGSMAKLTGPMTGLAVSTDLSREDAIVANIPAGRTIEFVPIISCDGGPVFLWFDREGVPVYLCASSHVVNIDQPLTGGHYDVKTHFCSAVPLVMFIKFMFPEVAWRPQELGACLIIDDPLLRLRYGFCDFPKLRDLMRQHGFTTNIAFIPWNWRRTSDSDAGFFREESRYFSVSVHGCDHTAREFGATSAEVLHSAARLAQCRMRNHETRTGIQHDRVMVFPQGVFSSSCPDILKQSGFLASVNTEIIPVDSHNARTHIRDVWDVAIMTYGDFPIFTRRYPWHGLENFAFDLLLGKPCLIVTHQDFFKDAGKQLIQLIEDLNSLKCSLNWDALRDVIRKACRKRPTGPGAEEVEMYGSELVIGNPSDLPIVAKVRKRKGKSADIARVLCDGQPVMWEIEGDYLVFSQRILPHRETCCRVEYLELGTGGMAHRSLKFEASVAARRMLSEFRDNYISQTPLLNAPMKKLRKVVKGKFWVEGWKS